MEKFVTLLVDSWPKLLMLLPVLMAFAWRSLSGSGVAGKWYARSMRALKSLGRAISKAGNHPAISWFYVPHERLIFDFFLTALEQVREGAMEHSPEGTGYRELGKLALLGSQRRRDSLSAAIPEWSENVNRNP